jgi:hypothetical protein
VTTNSKEAAKNKTFPPFSGMEIPLIQKYQKTRVSIYSYRKKP